MYNNMMKRTSSSHPEYGGAGFYIILAIVLFAALTYAVSQGSRFGTTTLTNDQAKLAAQEIIEYGSAMANTVQKLRLRGCTDIQVDFSGGGSKKGNGGLFPYANTNAPGDGSCNVFSANGGKLNPPTITVGSIDPSLPNQSWMHSQSFFVSASRVAGVGDDATTDLLFWFGRLDKDVCYEINKILGINLSAGGVTTADAFSCSSLSFDGTYPVCADPIGDSNTALFGKTAFCNQAQGSEYHYIFHQVLIAR